nr:MAG TPA: hypothetical protein [Caudoviricetes sp.]
MRNAIIVSALILASFLVGRLTKNLDPVKIVQYDTLPPVVRIDTIRDTVPVQKYKEVVRYDTIHDTADGKPLHLPIPISRYLFTDDSTYRMEVEGYNVKANSIEVYPRTVTQTIIQRVEVPGKPKRWGIGVSAGAALTPQGIRPYLGVGVQYNLIVF